MKNDQYNKYEYIIKNPWITRTIYFCAILAWFSVVYGYVIFFNLDKIYWFTIAPIVGIFTLYYCISYGINLFYKCFDLNKHNELVKRFWSDKKEPSIDIFLPICGEPTSIIKNTFSAVSKINYKNKKVYVLDDRGDEEHKLLAEKIGFKYLSRENKGFMKKSGNLKFGYENSTGEFIIIFDADFAPHEDFITELLPYMSDPKIAIVQSPQYFQADKEVHNRSALEYGAGHVQEDFYRIIQVSRDHFGGAICVGSNAIYRRAALDEIGGTAQIEHSEDVHTGFNLVNKGWKLKYIPIILAIGLCPAEMHSYFHQQHRWCSGSMSLLFSKKFWLSKIAFKTKLCFMSGFLYYISHALAILMTFQVFVLLFRHYDYISLKNAIPFFPYIIFTFFILPLFRKTPRRYGNFICRTAHLWSYSHAFVSNAVRKSVGWQPTGAKSKVSKAYKSMFYFAAGYMLVYIGLLGVAISQGKFPALDYNYYSVIFWVYYNIITTGIFLYHSYKVLDEVQKDENPKGLNMWRAKTIGLYLLGMAGILGGSIVF
jgi:cellulose synthase (UDP-forming)